MSILRLKDRSAVIAALREHDRLGPERFREVHGFGRATGYLLHHGGRYYDSKAVAGVAYGYEHGEALRSDEFSGGKGHAASALGRLGFEIVSTRRPPRWEEDEMLLALDVYLEYRGESLSKGHPAIVRLSERLRARLEALGFPLSHRVRNPAGIAQQVGAFHELDSTSARKGRTPSTLHCAVWERHARPEALRRRVAATARILGGSVESRAGTHATEPLVRTELHVDPETMAAPYERIRVSKARRTRVRWDALDGFDRGTEIHEDARAQLYDFLTREGFEVGQGRKNRLEYDLDAVRERLRIIVEVKSVPAELAGQRAQLRLGLGQLLWYRHNYCTLTGHEPVAVLMVSDEPVESETWLGACGDVGVVLTWPRRLASLIEQCKRARAQRLAALRPVRGSP